MTEDRMATQDVRVVPGPYSEELLDAALVLAAKGIAILPCHTPDRDGRCSCRRADCRSVGKHPRTTDGLTSATIDIEQIRQWWSRWPHANPGARTGRDSGVFILDVDADGFDALDELAASRGIPNWCPDTWTVRTGNLGAHLYFRHPGSDVKVRTTAGVIASGVDVRGDGGYAVLPPSRHVSRRRYEWVQGLAPQEMGLADAPLWLLELVIEHGTRPVGVAQPFPAASGSIETGRRNATLTSLGGAMRRRGFAEAAIEAALQVENQARCCPPLRPEEVSRIARSVGRYPSGEREIKDQSNTRRHRTLRVGGIELEVKQRGSSIG